MEIKDLYKQIDQLKSKLQSLKPLKTEDDERLWKKFRLEWNYNSNHIEGNSLTYGHTELLLIFDKITGDYTGREIEEMKAHDVAIKLILESVNDNDRDLSELFIRELNKIILVRPFWKEAITENGQTTSREITPGDYKKFRNSVRLQNGEIFHYTSPEETPSQMRDLLEFYSTNNRSTEVHKLWLAAMIHYKFVRIHPFDDGNGRVARLIMNYILLKNDFPPIIIKSDKKKEYLNALNKADVGDLESFVIYIGEQLIWSLEKSILAAEGKDISDEDDLNKEISVLKTELKSQDVLTTKASPYLIVNTVEQNIIPIFVLFEGKTSEFKDFFVEWDKQLTYEVLEESGTWSVGGKNSEWNKLVDNWLHNRVLNANKTIKNLRYTLHLKGFKKTTSGTSISSMIEVFFNDFNYTIRTNGQTSSEYPYEQKLTDEQQLSIVKVCIVDLIERIRNLNQKRN